MERKRLTRAVKLSLRSDREQYWTNLAERLEDAVRRHHSDAASKALKECVGVCRPMAQTLRDKDGEKITVLSDRVERFAEHFREHFNHAPPVGPFDPEDGIAEGVYDCSEAVPSFAETTAALKSMKRGKAAGIDGIAVEQLIGGGNALLQEFHEMVCCIWREKKVPVADSTSSPAAQKKEVLSYVVTIGLSLYCAVD